jgi:hypothetical protein
MKTLFAGEPAGKPVGEIVGETVGVGGGFTKGEGKLRDA